MDVDVADELVPSMSPSFPLERLTGVLFLAGLFAFLMVHLKCHCESSAF
jgi:hypothetical protein